MKKYPEHEDIMQKLLKLLYKDGGENQVLHASQTYGRLAKQFMLSPEQIKKPKNDNRWEPYWSNKVQSARNTLVKGRYIAPRRDGFHGVWKLTPRGIKEAQDPTHLGHRAVPKNKQTGMQIKRIVSPPLEPGQDAIDDLGSETPARKYVSAISYARDPRIRKEVERRSKGCCELCGKSGFKRPNGTKYIETHHIIALANEGEDRISNVIGLCPEHHREAHFGARQKALEREMIIRLKALAK